MPTEPYKVAVVLEYRIDHKCKYYKFFFSVRRCEARSGVFDTSHEHSNVKDYVKFCLQDLENDMCRLQQRQPSAKTCTTGWRMLAIATSSRTDHHLLTSAPWPYVQARLEALGMNKSYVWKIEKPKACTHDRKAWRASMMNCLIERLGRERLIARLEGALYPKQEELDKYVEECARKMRKEQERRAQIAERARQLERKRKINWDML